MQMPRTQSLRLRQIHHGGRHLKWHAAVHSRLLRAEDMPCSLHIHADSSYDTDCQALTFSEERWL